MLQFFTLIQALQNSKQRHCFVDSSVCKNSFLLSVSGQQLWGRVKRKKKKIKVGDVAELSWTVLVPYPAQKVRMANFGNLASPGPRKVLDAMTFEGVVSSEGKRTFQLQALQ